MDVERIPSESLDNDVLKEVCAVTAMAFKNTKSYVEIFREEVSREANLYSLMEKQFNMTHKKAKESIYCFRDEKKRVVASFLMIHSSCSFSLWDKMHAGLISLLFNYGFVPFYRMAVAGDFYDSIDDEIGGKAPHLRLQRMVVHPEFQGKGIGSRCLSYGLKEADELGLPVILSTQDERNVVFYGRLYVSLFLN